MHTGTNLFCPPFVPMTEILHEGKVGAASLNVINIGESESRMATLTGERLMYPGNYMQLKINKWLVMSDTPYERLTNRDVVYKAFGDVLIAGLGLGMILVPIAENPVVKSITVIESSQDVIDLVTSQFPKSEKINVVCADINDWVSPSRQKYTTVYFDIWPSICADNYEEMKALHRRYKKYVDYKAGGFMDSWTKNDVKRLASEDRYY